LSNVISALSLLDAYPGSETVRLHTKYRYCNFRYAYITNRRLDSAEFLGVDFAGVDFTGTTVGPNARFIACQFDGNPTERWKELTLVDGSRDLTGNGPISVASFWPK